MYFSKSFPSPNKEAFPSERLSGAFYFRGCEVGTSSFLGCPLWKEGGGTSLCAEMDCPSLMSMSMYLSVNQADCLMAWSRVHPQACIPGASAGELCRLGGGWERTSSLVP